MGWIEELEKKHQEKTAKETVEKKTAELTEFHEDQIRAKWFEQRLAECLEQKMVECSILEAQIAAYTDALKVTSQYVREAVHRLRIVGIIVHLLDGENTRKIYLPNVKEMAERGAPWKVALKHLDFLDYRIAEVESSDPPHLWHAREMSAYSFTITAICRHTSKGQVTVSLSQYTPGMVELDYLAIRPNKPLSDPNENLKFNYKGKPEMQLFSLDKTDYAIPLYEDTRETQETSTGIREKRDLPVANLTKENLDHLIKWASEYGRGEIIGEPTFLDIKDEKRRQFAKSRKAKERMSWTIKETFARDYLYMLGLIASFFIWSYVTVCLGLPMALVFLGIFGFRVFLNWTDSEHPERHVKK